MDVYYVIVTAYPKFKAEEFLKYSGAVIGCWVRCDLLPSICFLDKFLRNKISHETSWHVTSLVSAKVLCAEEEAGHELFEEAIECGFSARLNLTKKEFITLDDGEIPEVIMHNRSRYSDFIKKIRAGFCCTRRHLNSGRCFASVTPNGDDVLPVWSDKGIADGWQEKFTGSYVVEVEDSELAGLLSDIDRKNWVVGAGLSEGIIVTIDPLWLRDMILEPTE